MVQVVKVKWKDLRDLRNFLEEKAGRSVSHDEFMEGMKILVDKKTGEPATLRDFYETKPDSGRING